MTIHSLCCKWCAIQLERLQKGYTQLLLQTFRRRCVTKYEAPQKFGNVYWSIRSTTCLHCQIFSLSNMPCHSTSSLPVNNRFNWLIWVTLSIAHPVDGCLTSNELQISISTTEQQKKKKHFWLCTNSELCINSIYEMGPIALCLASAPLKVWHSVVDRFTMGQWCNINMLQLMDDKSLTRLSKCCWAVVFRLNHAQSDSSVCVITAQGRVAK